VGYLHLGILTYINTAVSGVYKISYGKIGPTEVRVFLLGVNAIFYFGTNPLINLGRVSISSFDAMVLCIRHSLFSLFPGLYVSEDERTEYSRSSQRESFAVAVLSTWRFKKSGVT
jgi:hypothetical protein